MKILFLINNILEQNNGVSNKILNQLSAFNEFSTVDICHLYKSDNGFRRVFYENEDVSQINRLTGSKVYKYKNLFLFNYSDVYNYCLVNSPNLIYIRYTHFSNPFFFRFLSKVKKLKIKVILELPNYPYDSEYLNLGAFSKIKLFLDKIYRGRLKSFVDRIATMSDEPYIFNIPVIKINNAVSQNTLKNVDLSEKKTKKLTFVAAANLSNWHGYDRFIISLSRLPEEYFGTVLFHLVGDGEELIRLKKLAFDLGVSSFVIFHGEQNKAYLKELYCNSHIGVDSLGRHRSNNYFNDSIKSKEYLACGLPVLMSHVDPILCEQKFVYKVEANDEPFNFVEIIKWYNDNDFNSNRVLINNFAKVNCTWESILQRTVKSVL